MSALQIIQNVASVSGFVAPTHLRGNRDPLAISMLVLLNRSGTLLSKKRGSFGQSWPKLTKEYSITTEPGVENYPLPADFADLISDTTWDRSTYYEGTGPLSPQEWQTIKSSLAETVSLSPLYRIRLNAATGSLVLALDPVPSSSQIIAFEYVSRNWASDGEGTPIIHSSITADSQVPIFDQDLMELDLEWRFKRSRGLSFQAELAEFEMQRDQRFALESGMRTVSMAGILPTEEDEYGPGVVVNAPPATS